MRVPASEFEVLWIFSGKLITDVHPRCLALVAFAGMIVRQAYLYPYHKVQLLPLLVVSRAICHDYLYGSEPPRVHVRRAVHPLP